MAEETTLVTPEVEAPKAAVEEVPKAEAAPVDLDTKVFEAVQKAMAQLMPKQAEEPLPKAEKSEVAAGPANADTAVLDDLKAKAEAAAERAEMAETRLALNEMGVERGYYDDIIALYKLQGKNEPLNKWLKGQEAKYPNWFGVKQEASKSTGTPIAASSTTTAAAQAEGIGARLAKARRKGT